VNMPKDYFVGDGRSSPAHKPPMVVRALRRVAKNLLGLLFVATGLVLSLPLVPGPGLLLILSGLMLMDFPGKRALELRMVSKPLVLGPLNRLRAAFGRPPLNLPDARKTEREENRSRPL
jgi:hypothetical protein